MEALQSTLNQEEDDVTEKKKKELVHLDETFLGLLDASRDDLNKNRITPKRIRRKLFVRRASDTKTNSSLVASLHHKIKEVETVDEIFELFSAEQCWSALNSGLLERIINDHCSESVEVQKRKKDFLKEQQAFRRNTKLRQFAKISNDITVGSAFSEIVFEMEDGWDGTLEDAEMIRHRLKAISSPVKAPPQLIPALDPTSSSSSSPSHAPLLSPLTSPGTHSQATRFLWSNRPSGDGQTLASSGFTSIGPPLSSPTSLSKPSSGSAFQLVTSPPGSAPLHRPPSLQDVSGLETARPHPPP